MTRETIAFIGGGHMGSSLIAGLVSDGYDPADLIVSEPDADKREQLARHYGVQVTQDNAAAQGAADVVLLCVKPQMAHTVCSDLGQALTTKIPLYISIMAGIRESSIQAWLGGPRPLVRTMPNTPAMIQAGAIVMHATPAVSPGQRNRAETIMRAGGLTRWVDEEELLDAVTAVSGSGPAYFFLLMEELEKVAVELGLDAESARLLTIQTALGAARMAMESSLDPKELRERVTSPGGTTESALKVLMEGDFSNLIARAVRSAQARSQELSTLLATNP